MKIFPSPKSNNKDALIGTFGAAIGIAITWLVSDALLSGVAPLLVVSMGASAVILFSLPTAPAAQPGAVLIAHVAAAFFGVAAAQIFSTRSLPSINVLGHAKSDWLRLASKQNRLKESLILLEYWSLPEWKRSTLFA